MKEQYDQVFSVVLSEYTMSNYLKNEDTEKSNHTVFGISTLFFKRGGANVTLFL